MRSKYRVGEIINVESTDKNIQITAVRAERLKNISEEDAISEGIEKYGPFGEFKGSKHSNGGMMRYRAYRKASIAFLDVWDSLPNLKFDWSYNPFVWHVS